MTKCTYISMPGSVSIRAPREGGDFHGLNPDALTVVSIRAPREGGDRRGRRARERGGVSIRAPREGGDAPLLALSRA